jgi:hypothetical protein
MKITNSSLLTITLLCSVITTPVYKHKILSPSRDVTTETVSLNSISSSTSSRLVGLPSAQNPLFDSGTVLNTVYRLTFAALYDVTIVLVN